MNFQKVTIASFLVVSFSSQAIVQFQAGTPAKASEVNANFSELSDRVQVVETSTATVSGTVSDLAARIQAVEGKEGNNGDTDGYVSAKVNGVEMMVYSGSSYWLDSFSIKTNKGVSVVVDAEGYPSINTFHYESADCTGQPYFDNVLSKSNKDVGYTYPNPKLDGNTVIQYDGVSIYYTSSSSLQLVKLNYKSTGNPSSCSINSGTIIGSKVLPNDPNITGISSVPLIITGIGTNLTVTEEVGEGSGIPSGMLNVYASGVKIGTIPDWFVPDSADEAFFGVKLDSSPGQTVTMYKDGTYSGFNAGSNEYLYYLSEDCSGNAYVKVLNDYDKEWWSTTGTIKGPIKNNGLYYELSSEIYKISSGAKSKHSYSSGSCSSNTDSNKKGYKLATITTEPDLPIFTPPITIEGWEEETQYDSLLEAY